MSFALRCICVTVALSACGGHTLDIGSADGGPPASAALRQDGASGPTGPVWNGVLENAQFSNGSNRLKMTLTVAPDGTATGTLLLGDGDLLQPPTDPDVGYPPGVQLPSTGPLGFFEGFPYTMIGGRLSGSTLAFHVAEYELWTQWCSLQKAYVVRTADGQAVLGLDGVVSYMCWSGVINSLSPGSACSNEYSMQDVPADCGKMVLCESGVCDCSATGCRVSDSMHQDVVNPLAREPALSFELTITGATADGTMSGLLGDHGVHFVHAEP